MADAGTEEGVNDEAIAAQVEGIVIELDAEAERRLWIETLVPVVGLWRSGSHPSGRVQLALDLMHIAACERLARLCNSDLGVITDGRTGD
jgi:hypothetical protein